MTGSGIHSLSKQEKQVIDKKQPRLGNEPRINVPEDALQPSLDT